METNRRFLTSRVVRFNSFPVEIVEAAAPPKQTNKQSSKIPSKFSIEAWAIYWRVYIMRLLWWPMLSIPFLFPSSEERTIMVRVVLLRTYSFDFFTICRWFKQWFEFHICTFRFLKLFPGRHKSHTVNVSGSEVDKASVCCTTISVRHLTPLGY